MHRGPVVMRRATRDDEAQAVALWERAGLTRPWVDASRDFVRGVECEQSDILLAVDGGLVIGTTLVADDGHRGWLYSVAVEPDYRGAGIGAALIRAAEAWLAHRGQTQVRLLVRAENLGVMGFYERLGYADIACSTLGRSLV